MATPVQIRYLDSGTVSDSLRVVLLSDAAGICEAEARPWPRVAIHVGRPVRLACRHGDEHHTGLAIHGDVDIIPSGLPARWEMQEPDAALVLSLCPSRLRRMCAEAELDPDRLELRSRFQIRDPQIERIGWSLLAEVSQGYPSGQLFWEAAAQALGERLLYGHSNASRPLATGPRGFPPLKLRQVATYIEDHLGEALSLTAIAGVAGVSVSHLKTQFRQATGVPVHQFVIRRRVERAALLLLQGQVAPSQVALEAGFAHQSHLARHMRRALGVLPRQLSRA